VASRSLRVALLFFALAIITRLPFQTDNLWAHDSVLYERAIERFDPLDQRPQPPGYLYYVLLIRAVDAVTGDANRAMTLVALFADALAVALLYLLAARLYDERTARISALFLLTAVTFWAYGGIAYPYTLLAALSIGCAIGFWRAAVATSGRTGALIAASALWGIAVGFRSDLAIFLAPLWLIAAWGAPLLAWIGGGASS
jgi:4-amino-4-deoxy-L-arabinose transferase-like glycosyltransferase